jgi:hypothetical protein
MVLHRLRQPHVEGSWKAAARMVGWVVCQGWRDLLEQLQAGDEGAGSMLGRGRHLQNRLPVLGGAMQVREVEGED